MFHLNYRTFAGFSLRLAALTLCASSACGANNAGIALLVKNVDSSIVRLEVNPYVNGKPLPKEIFKDFNGMSEVLLGFQLPVAYLGSPISFQVDGVDVNECVFKKSIKMDVATDSARRYDIPLDLVADKDINLKVTDNYFAIHGSSGKDIWAVGGRGAAVHWDGCYWKQAPVSDGSDLIKVYVPPKVVGRSVDAFAISLSKIYKYQNGAWSVDHSPTLDANMIMQGIHGSSDGNVWAMATFIPNAGPTMGGPNSLIFQRGANGQWSTDNSQTGLPNPPTPFMAVSKYFLRSIHVINAANVLVGGSEGNSDKPATDTVALLRWQVGTWRHETTQVTPIPSGQIYSIWGTAPDDYWFGGGPTSLRHVMGGTFQMVPGYDTVVASMTGGPMFRTQSIHGSSNNNIWVNVFLGGANPQSRTIRYDGTWKEDMAVEAKSKQITDQYVAGDRDVWLVGYNGKRIHWDGSSVTEF